MQFVIIPRKQDVGYEPEYQMENETLVDIVVAEDHVKVATNFKIYKDISVEAFVSNQKVTKHKVTEQKAIEQKGDAHEFL